MIFLTMRPDRKRTAGKGKTAKSWGYETLLNALSKKVCEDLWEKELKTQTKEESNDKGCLLSKRHIAIGGYPMIQIPFEYCVKLDSKTFGEVNNTNWTKIKRQFSVPVHALAYTATTGNLLKDYVKGWEVGHKCGNGRKNSEGDDKKGCITPDHLGQIHHDDNMAQQRCLVFVDISGEQDEGIWIKVCKHDFCIGTLEQEEFSKKVQSLDIKVNFKSGKSKKVLFEFE